MVISTPSGLPLGKSPSGIVFPKGVFQLILLGSNAQGLRAVRWGGATFFVPEQPQFQGQTTAWVSYDPVSQKLIPAPAENIPKYSLEEKEEGSPTVRFPESFPEREVPEGCSLWNYPETGSWAGGGQGGAGCEGGIEEDGELRLLFEIAAFNTKNVGSPYRWVKLPVAFTPGIDTRGWAFFLWNTERRCVETALLQAKINGEIRRWRFLPVEKGRWYGYIERGEGHGRNRVDIVL